MGTTIFNKAFAETELCMHLDRYVTEEGWKRLNKYKETGEVEFQDTTISFAELQNFLGLEFGWKDGKNFSKFWVPMGKSLRNFNGYQKDTLDEYFDKTKAPLYLDQEDFQKRLLFEECLNRHCNPEYTPFLYDREELTEEKEDGSRYQYRLRLSDLILYNNNARF